MALGGTALKQIRQALKGAFPDGNALARVVSDADIGLSFNDLKFGTSDYIDAIQQLLERARGQGQKCLEKLLTAACSEAPANQELQEALRLVQEPASPPDNTQREERRRAYLARIVEKFSLLTRQEGPAEGLGRLWRDTRQDRLPLLVAQDPAAEEGQPLARLLLPGARCIVVAEYPDGLVPIIHQAVVERAKALDASDLAGYLPIVYSDHWGGGKSWVAGESEKVAQRVLEEQDTCLSEGRAVLFFDEWEAGDMMETIKKRASHPDNIVVIGATPGSPSPDGYRKLHPCPLSREAQQTIAGMWLEAGDAAALLKAVGDSPALAEAARSPYSLTVMCIAQRLRAEEEALWAGRPPGATAGLVPARMTSSLLNAMWAQAYLPGKLCSRAVGGSEAEFKKLAREVFLSFQKGEDRLRLEIPAAGRLNGTSGDVKKVAKREGFLMSARSTGMFVSSTREGEPVLEPLHPALWDVLAARGLQRDQHAIPTAARCDEKWASLCARAADLLEAGSTGAAGKFAGSDCYDWLKTVSRANPGLGIAALVRSVVVPRSGLPKLLGLRALPDKLRWSGYRPDKWRALESKLRGLEALPSHARDDSDVVRLFQRLIPGAHSFDLALLRLCLSDMGRKYAREGRLPPAGFEELWEVDHFFELAGRPCQADSVDWAPVPADEVSIGASADDHDAWDNERPLLRVRVPAFEMSRLPVTNALYETFDPSWRTQQEAESGSLPPDWAELPAVQVSWYEAWIFAEWMRARLPSEVQWERAAWGARASIRDEVPYWFSDEKQLKCSVWFRETAGECVHRVGGPPEADDADLEPRPFLLHDMLGSAWEWCEDEQGYVYSNVYKEGEVIDFQGPFQADPNRRSYLVNRVIRGGSWESEKEDCRCSARQFAYPAVRSNVIGFRLVRNG